MIAMPRLGLGTWPMKGAECQHAVASALALGYRHLDTAEMYGNEEAVGAAINASGIARENIFLTTKVWNDKTEGQSFRRAFDGCLKRLAQPYVDLLLIHWPSAAMQLESILEAMAGLREEGLAKAVGVANFPPALLTRAVAARILPIAALQVEHHVYLDQSRLLALCAEHGIMLTSYTPLAKGRVTEDPAIQRIAARHGASCGQVALAYLLAMPGVAAIPKAASAARQQENLDSQRLALTAEDRAALAALANGTRIVNPGYVRDWNA